MRAALVLLAPLLAATVAGCAQDAPSAQRVESLPYTGSSWIRGAFTAGGDACALGVLFTPGVPPTRAFGRFAPDGRIQALQGLGGGRLLGPVGFDVDGETCHAAVTAEEAGGGRNATLRILSLGPDGEVRERSYPAAVPVALVFAVRKGIAYVGPPLDVQRFALEPAVHLGPLDVPLARLQPRGVPFLEKAAATRLWLGDVEIPLDRLRERVWPVHRAAASDGAILAAGEAAGMPGMLAFGLLDAGGDVLHVAPAPPALSGLRSPTRWAPPEPLMVVEPLPGGRFLVALPGGAPFTDAAWVSVFGPAARPSRTLTVPAADVTAYSWALAAALKDAPDVQETWLAAFPLAWRVEAGGEAATLMMGGPVDGPPAAPRLARVPLRDLEDAR